MWRFSATAAFSIVHTYESHLTKGEPWNYPVNAAAQTIQKRPNPPLPRPPLKNIYFENSVLLEGKPKIQIF